MANVQNLIDFINSRVSGSENLQESQKFPEEGDQAMTNMIKQFLAFESDGPESSSPAE